MSEPKVVLASIRTAEESYFNEFGTYVAFDSIPDGPPTSERVAPKEIPAGAITLGWAPDSERGVYCRYAVAVGSDRDGQGAKAFTAEAVCDLDEDEVQAAWGYVQPDRETGTVAPGPFGRCPSDGVLRRDTGARVLAQVGPCDPRSGIDVF